MVAFFVALVPAAGLCQGVMEINQTIVDYGLPPCDSTAGFPCTLESPGSYRLSSDLEVPADTTGLLVTMAQCYASCNATIDLAGFALFGPNSCETGTCSGSSAGAGIEIDCNGCSVVVRDGRIHGFGGSGIRTIGADNRSIRVEDMQVDNNAAFGVHIEYGGTLVVDSTVRRNGMSGIFARYGSIRIQDNVVARNLDDGIECGTAGNSSVIVGNNVWLNGSSGVIVAAASVVLDNQIFGHSSTALVCSSAGHTGYARNVIQGSGGTVSGGCVEIGMNLCGTNTTCP